MSGPWKVVDDSYDRFEVLASYPSQDGAQGFADATNLYSARLARVVGPGYGCSCGPERVEIIKPGDEVFYPRVGCSRCDQWDEPPRLRDR